MFGVIDFKKHPGRQMPGIWALNGHIDKNLEVIIKPAEPITLPMLQAYDYLRKNYPRGFGRPVVWTEFIEDSVELACGIRALMLARVNPMKTSSGLPPLLREDGYPMEIARFTLDPLLPILEVLPRSADDVRSIEQILIAGNMHWQSFSHLHDVVQQNGYEKYGGIKSWVFGQLVGLGFGYLDIRHDSHRRGRPPKTFVPNDWGTKFVKILVQDSRVQVNDDMRRSARVRPIEQAKKKKENLIEGTQKDADSLVLSQGIENLKRLKLL